MPGKNIILWLIVFFSTYTPSFTQQQSRADSIARTFRPDYTIIIAGSIGAVYGVSASDFFKEYNNPFTIGGKASSFNIPLSTGATVKAAYTQGIRYGVSGDFFKAVMRDNYDHAVVVLKENQLDTIGTRNIGSELSVSSIPVLATIEFIPVEAQFTTYFGVGAGVAFNKIFWKESVQTTVKNDPRTGGVYTDERKITPAGRIYAGVELDFDKRRRQSSILGSLLLEVRYTYIPVSSKLLEKFSSFPGAPERWKDDFSVGGSGLGLNIGVSVEFPGYFKK
ncbi:MAG: hypothetical protein V4642_14225 [Bacteroidota bacterium]